MKHIFVGLSLALILTAGCTANGPLAVPTEEPHAGLNPHYISSRTSTPYEIEETSEQIRATVHEAIRRDMLKTGRYPKQGIMNSELLSLRAIAPNSVTGNSYWNYKALVRINLERNSVDVQFMAFERNDEIIVRKVSL